MVALFPGELNILISIIKSPLTSNRQNISWNHWNAFFGRSNFHTIPETTMDFREQIGILIQCFQLKDTQYGKWLIQQWVISEIVNHSTFHMSISNMAFLAKENIVSYATKCPSFRLECYDICRRRKKKTLLAVCGSQKKTKKTIVFNCFDDAIQAWA